MTLRRDRGLAGYRLGLGAERRCAWALRCKGYRVLEQRFRTPFGEIDLIAKRGRTLIFVEVKARATVMAAGEAISPASVARMQRAAQFYLSIYPKFVHIALRLDVMFVTPERSWPIHLSGAAELHA